MAPPQATGAHLEWIEHDSGRRDDLLAGRFDASATGAWDGLSIARGRASPGETRDGYTLGHVIVFDVGGPGWRDFHWPGLLHRSGVTPPLAISLLPARMRYSARWRPGPETVIVEIAPSLVDAVASRDDAGAELAPAAAMEDPFVAHVSLALAEEARAGAPGGALAAEGLAIALVAHLLRRGSRFGPDEHPAAPLAAPRLHRVVDHIRSHLDVGLSLRDLADVARMDVYRFVREFKEATGLPPHRYVTQARIDRAKALLRERALSISEIALRTGFATPSHFSTTFRRMTNATPRAYRDAAP